MPYPGHLIPVECSYFGLSMFHYGIHGYVIHIYPPLVRGQSNQILYHATATTLLERAGAEFLKPTCQRTHWNTQSEFPTRLGRTMHSSRRLLWTWPLPSVCHHSQASSE